MDFQKIRESFPKGSIILSDGKLSVFYATVYSGNVLEVWANESFSDTDPDGNPDFSKSILAQLILNSERFEMHFFSKGVMRFDFVIPSAVSGGNIKSCWFMPLKREKTPEEYDQILIDRIRSNPEPWREFMDFISDFDLSDPNEGLLAIQIWDAEHTEFDDTPVTPDEQHRWDEVLRAARAFYATTAIGALEIDEPEPGQNFGYVEFQTETSDHLAIVLTGRKKELFHRLVSVSDVVSFEAGNNDGGLLTYINIAFYS